MHLIEHTTITEAAVYYSIGALAWAFFLSLAGHRLDRYFLLTLLIWPLAVVYFAGQLTRFFFRSLWYGD